MGSQHSLCKLSPVDSLDAVAAQVTNPPVYNPVLRKIPWRFRIYDAVYKHVCINCTSVYVIVSPSSTTISMNVLTGPFYGLRAACAFLVCSKRSLTNLRFAK